MKTKSTTASSSSEVEALYDELRKAYSDFMENGKNKGGIFDEEEETSVDLTESLLVESENFTREDESETTRFSAPKFWTVENYNIPSATEGVRGGLDNYPGKDCLTIGVWGDKDNAPAESDISNARVYKKVQLEAGRYFFGSIYNTIYNLDAAYTFAATETLATGDISQQSLAWMKIAECGTDGNYWGIWFTLDEPKEVLLGWQVDLLNGAGAEEFRAIKVKLAKLDGGEADAIETIKTDTNADAPVEIYSLQGIRLSSIPQHGFYLLRKGGKTLKCFKR